jgi:hypothetical protein
MARRALVALLFLAATAATVRAQAVASPQLRDGQWTPGVERTYVEDAGAEVRFAK